MFMCTVFLMLGIYKSRTTECRLTVTIHNYIKKKKKDLSVVRDAAEVHRSCEVNGTKSCEGERRKK